MERFNTGFAAHMKHGRVNEDALTIVQDMGIDKHIKCSYFGVYDGHNGPDCSLFLQANLHMALRNNLADKFSGLKTSKSVSKSIRDILN